MVVLSHLGAEPDFELAAKIPGIDIIVGGHSHTLLHEPRIINGTLITQARAFGEFIGRLDLEYDKGNLNKYNYTLIPADFSVPEDPEFKTWLDKYAYPLTLENSLSPNGHGKNSLGAFVAKAISEKHPCDVVIIKTGLFKQDLPEGQVSAENFFTCLWPYIGAADKDLSPEQVMEIVTGRSPPLTRFLLNRSAALSSLISAAVPTASIDKIEALCADKAGTDNALCMERFTTQISGNMYKLIMDLPSWVDLYREGIITDDCQYENLNEEIIDVLLAALK
jgi:hypothetical protein